MTTTDAIAIREAEKSTFIRGELAQPLEPVYDEEGWPLAEVGGAHIPILDTDFEVKIIQPGHVGRDKSLSGAMYKFQIKGMEDDLVERMRILPITIVQHGYRMFAAYEGGDTENSLLCYSIDGVHPSERIEAPMAPVCSAVETVGGQLVRKPICTCAQWLDGKKPDCKEVLTVAFFDIDRKFPMRMQLKGTAMSAWHDLRKAYKTARNVAKLKGRSVNDYYLEMVVVNNGTYATPSFIMVDSGEEKVSRFQPLLRHYMATLYSKIEEPTESILSSAQLQDTVDIPVGENESSAESFSL